MSQTSICPTCLKHLQQHEAETFSSDTFDSSTKMVRNTIPIPIRPSYTTHNLNFHSGPHLAWFHAAWTDADATSWSIHGRSKSLEESRLRMVEAIEKGDAYVYCVFAKKDDAESERPNDPGVQLGSVGLRRQASGPTIPELKRGEGDEGKELDLRILGYAYFRHAWGKGYATEAARALLDAYSESVKEEKAKGEKVYYVEAGVDEGNPASVAIIKKLGFEKVGFKEEKKPIFLGGAWRYDGYWIYGMYV